MRLKIVRHGSEGWFILVVQGAVLMKTTELQAFRVPATRIGFHVYPIRSLLPVAAAGTAYVAFEHHWFDDLRPYLYKTGDFGKTWTNLTANLPVKDYLWVVKEDPRNPQLLYVGSELGLHVSCNGVGGCVRIHPKNLPP